MLLGYVQADLPPHPLVRLLYLLLVVVAPALGGGLLLRSWFVRRSYLKRRRDRLRQQTLEAEVLKLARDREGSLTVLDLVSELGITREEAGAVLDSFAVHGAAEAEISESGVLIYTFAEMRNLPERRSAGGGR
jgi:hypothetical protein